MRRTHDNCSVSGHTSWPAYTLSQSHTQTNHLPSALSKPYSRQNPLSRVEQRMLQNAPSDIIKIAITYQVLHCTAALQKASWMCDFIKSLQLTIQFYVIIIYSMNPKKPMASPPKKPLCLELVPLLHRSWAGPLAVLPGAEVPGPQWSEIGFTVKTNRSQIQKRNVFIPTSKCIEISGCLLT